MRIALSLIFVLGLTGCGYFSNPGPMPTGYKYHDKPYNAKPGPELLMRSKSDCNEGCAMEYTKECDMKDCQDGVCSKTMTPKA